MVNRIVLEVAANSLASALAAQAGGADRVELCENLGEGGCTPSYGTLVLARERLHIPLYVLIRPRSGDFVYSPDEWEVMRRDVALCRQVGCDGVVIGALDANGNVDVAGCAMLMAEAGGMGVTFHRAFDCVSDRRTALQQVIALGCERILTSGGADSAPQGAARIAEDVAQASGRLALMAGAGVTAGNVTALVQATGVRDVHASGKTLYPGQGRAGPVGLEAHFWRTSAAVIHEIRQQLTRDFP